MQKRSKKGFTLAELLIVVAIIAVLVAIAVPLFVGALDKANKATEDANIRAARGTAAVYLLENTSDTTKLWPEGVKGWDVKATVSSTGSITIDEITAFTTATGSITTESAKKQSDGSYKVEVILTNADITAAKVNDAKTE